MGVEVVKGHGKWVAGDTAGPDVVHGCETVFVAYAYPAPDAIFGCDEVGEALAGEGEAGEGGGVQDGGLEEDLGEDLGRDAGDWAWWWWGGFGGGLFAGDGERCKGSNEPRCWSSGVG